MKDVVERIKNKYLDIQAIIGHNFTVNHLEDSQFVTQLSERVEQTYIAMNEGMCDELELCHTCAQNRDNLGELMVMLNDIEAGATITDSVGDHFMAFSLELNQVLERINGVLVKI